MGCGECEDRGEFDITVCAKTLVPSEAWNMIMWAIRADEKRILPVGGGGLDQTVSFMACWDFISSEVRRVEAEIGIKKESGR